MGGRRLQSTELLCCRLQGHHRLQGRHSADASPFAAAWCACAGARQQSAQRLFRSSASVAALEVPRNCC